MQTGTTARDRAVGALAGLAVGDAVGTTVEFRQPGSFEPLTDMVGGGPFDLDPGQWTDDTSMALCLAESILDTGTLDPADQLRRYVAWWRHGYWSSTGLCFDIGNTTMAALARFERHGTVTEAHVDQDQAANGSLMRLAAVPIRWCTDVAEAAERSGESSRTTHLADRPVDACRVLGAMIAALIQGADADQVLDPDFWQFGPLHPEVEAVARGSWRRKQPPAIRGTGYCVDALEAALWAVGGATDLRDAVLRAANLGDDADTTAAIAGQLAGARWGWSGVPAPWQEQLAEAERIGAIAGRLHDLATSTPPDGDWLHDDTVHGYWVDPGKILAGEYPGAAKAEVARTKIGLLVDHGMRTFVDLTAEVDGLLPYEPVLDDVARARGLSLQRIHHPIPDMGVTAAEGYDEVANTITRATAKGGVYVHCWGGIGRTGTVVGCLLVDTGLDAIAALTRIDELRSVTRKAPVAAPQTQEQIDIVHGRAARRGT